MPSWDAKVGYVRGLVNTRKPKRRRKDIISSRKQASHDCFLSNDAGQKVRVCQTFFLSTLCIGKDSFKRWVKDNDPPDSTDNSADSDVCSEEEIVNVPDQATKKTRHKVNRQHVNEWIDTLPKVPSHYCRSSSKRVYVEATFRSQSHMYKIYSSWCADNSYVVVSRQIFAEMLELRKISIHRPRKDQCDVCCSYQVGQLDEQDYQEHRAKQQEAREAKQRAKESANERKLVVTMDLQSVLLAPNLSASAIYYKTKLQIHNFTFYSLNDGEVTLYV